MTHAKGKDSLEGRAARGIYTLVEPMDYLILEALPDEGELVMGYYPMVVSARQLAKETFKGNLKPTQLAGDIRRLRAQGLAVKVGGRGTSGTRESGYQRTRKGRELLENWKKD